MVTPLSEKNHRNTHFLAIEMCKVKLGIAPSVMEDIFEKE